MKKIFSIGIDIPSEDVEYVNINSTTSLSDVDIVIFRPVLNNNMTHWRTELYHFVSKVGGTLFVILSEKIYHSSNYCNYDSLDFIGAYLNPIKGSVVKSTNPIVLELFDNFHDLLSYEIFIYSTNSNIKYTPLFETIKQDRMLGAYRIINKGEIILLPNINFDSLQEYDKDEDFYYWGEKAKKKAKILIHCFLKICHFLKNDDGETKSPKPEWIKNEKFNLQKSEGIKCSISKKEEELETIQTDLLNLNSEFEEEESLKDLLFETGKPLEKAVRKALQILGYNAEGYNDGILELDQVILSPEGHRFIGECEGKDNKDIDISKFRQLSESLNADFAREEVDEKAYGLLIGNPQRLLKPEERTLSFTNKCKIGAERDKIGLITTVDLFHVCRYISENNDIDFAAECRKAIFNQLGKEIEFPKIPETEK